MRASALLESDPSAAAQQAGAILATCPGNEAANLLLATACRRLGDPARALGALQTLAIAHPTSALIHLELGRTHAACGRSDEAMATFERAVELDFTLADAWRELSVQRLAAGDTASADAAYLHYSRLAPEPPELLDAYVAFNSKRMEAAESAVLRRLREAPTDVAALILLATIASRRGDEAAAEELLGQVLQFAPCHAAAREHLAQLLIRQGRADEALPLIERSMVAKPRNPTLAILKAEALRLADRHADGLAIITGLIADHPNNADLWLVAGNQQRFIGNPQNAVEAYQHSIVLRPGYGEAYWALSNLKTFRFSAADRVSMRQDLATAAASSPDAVYLEFALGKALEDEEQYTVAFAHYARGNARARADLTYDANATTAFVRRFKATFTRSFFAEREGWGSAARDPIFIVGLPRCGSTLLEQILASHSEVEGTRELADIPTMARALASRARAGTVKYPESMESLDESGVQGLAAHYLGNTRRHRPLGKRRFVDKMLGNFLNIALIQLMFPRATVIDCRRHPMACGFSCYKQLFNPGMNFAYDLREIGLYYRDYTELMEHVDTVLPGRVHRVHYERLIADTEGEVRRLLEFCRLPFESQCLQFHENRRVAQTISSEQVRRPIYAEAVDQWRHFEPWLGSLRIALADPSDH
ncbi:MAG: sulfotransferase [Gammaproteobacteria bacterium]